MPMWDTGGHTAAAFPWNLLAKACRTVPSVFRSSAPSAAAAGRLRQSPFPAGTAPPVRKSISFQLGQCRQCFFCQRQHSKHQPCPQQPAPVRSLFRSTLPQLVGYGLQQLRRDLAGLPLPRQEIFPQRFGVFRLAQLHLSGKGNPLLPAETEVCRQYLLLFVFISSKQTAHFSLCRESNAAQQPVASPQQPAFRAAVICGKPPETGCNRYEADRLSKYSTPN